MTMAFNPGINLNVRTELQGAYQQINQLVLGKELQVKLALSCLLAGGHLLLEDLPGMGKTVLSHALAVTLGLDYKRVQFTNDLLPADLLGAAIFERETSAFRFMPGPVFSELLLADEINRATPKTQSALLEAMEERQVSIEGETRPLPAPFFVIATQNPTEQLGTSPLPESQLDRFMMRLQMGYPTKSAELAILAGDSRRELLQSCQFCLSKEALQAAQQGVKQLPAHEQTLAYLHALLEYSRESGVFVAGLSTRAGLAVLQAAKAFAWLSDDEYLLPHHIQAVFGYVAGHRLQQCAGGSAPFENGQLILNTVAVPR